MPRTVKTILDEDENKLLIDSSGENAAGDSTDGILVDDVDVEGKPDPKSAAKDAKKKPTAEEEATALKKQLEEARARADEAERRADEADKRVTTAKSAAEVSRQKEIDAHAGSIKTKIANAQTTLESIKQQLKQAKASGDGDAEVDLQDALTDARYQLNAATWEEKNFNKWVEDQKEAARRAPILVDGDKATSPYTAKERKWISKHPEFSTSKKFSRVAKLAAQEAREEGHEQDSTAYFNYIENTLRDEGLLDDDKDPTSGAGDDIGASLAAAPQRDGNGGTNKPVGKNPKYPYLPSGFRIPPDWVQAAEDQGFEGKEGALEYANLRLEEDTKAKGNA